MKHFSTRTSFFTDKKRFNVFYLLLVTLMSLLSTRHSQAQGVIDVWINGPQQVCRGVTQTYTLSYSAPLGACSEYYTIEHANGTKVFDSHLGSGFDANYLNSASESGDQLTVNFKVFGRFTIKSYRNNNPGFCKQPTLDVTVGYYVTGPSSFDNCTSNTVTYYYEKAPGVTLSWQFTAGMGLTPVGPPPTANTGNYSFTFNPASGSVACGNLTVTGTSGCGIIPPYPVLTFPLCRTDYTISSIAGPQYIDCNTGPNATVTYSINAVSNATYSWTSSGSNIGMSPTPNQNGSPTATFNIQPFSAGSGSGTVSVTVNRCGVIKTKTMIVSRQVPPSVISGNSSICANSYGVFTAPAGSNYSWSVQGPYYISFNGSSLINVQSTSSTGSGVIILTYNRPCDNLFSTVRQGIFTSQCGGFAAKTATKSDSTINVYPNPAGEQLTIENIGEGKSYQLKLYNQYNQLVKEAITQKFVHTFTVKDLPEGLYFLHIYNDKGVLSKKQILIKK